jgi:hypothetical protein
MCKRVSVTVTVLSVLLLSGLGTRVFAEEDVPIRIGIIGLTTSHVVAFTKLINDPAADGVLADMQVVAGFTGGVPDNPDSWGRREKFTKDLAGRGVKIYETIDELLENVDAVLLESVDGRPHLEQAKPVIAAGKPLFIDKPMAASLADVIEIFRLAKEADVPCFSSSSLRFASGFQQMRNEKPAGDIIGCDAWSPCSLEEHHPDLFWYGVHGVEILYTIMGTGCQTVTRVSTPGTDVVVGVWEGGRVATYRGIRSGKATYGATVFGTKAVMPGGKYDGYQPLVIEIGKFFKSGMPPVSAEETIELFAFMEAADESKRQGGRPVSIAEVIQTARQVHAR